MPQLSHDVIETFVADNYMRAVGKPNLLTFSFTVRDFDQMKMYRAFSILYAAQKNHISRRFLSNSKSN